MTRQHFTDPNDALQFIFDQVSDLTIKYEALKGYTALLASAVSASTGFNVDDFNRLLVEAYNRAEGTHETDEQRKQIAEMRAIAVYLTTGDKAEIIPFPRATKPDQSEPQ